MKNPLPAMNELAPKIKAALPAGALFALLVYGDDETGQGGHYISNAERASMVAAMREAADRIESRMPPEIGN